MDRQKPYQAELSTTDRLDFGKYKNRLVSDLIQIDPKYLKWAKKEGLITFNTYLDKLLS